MRPFQQMNRVINEDCESRNNHRYAVVVKDLDTTRARTKLLSCLVSTLSSAVAQNLVAHFDEALAERELLWRNVLSGTEDAHPSPRHARGITPDDGDGDDEHPLARKRMKIQSLAELSDAEIDRTWLCAPQPPSRPRAGARGVPSLGPPPPGVRRAQ